MAKTQGHSGGRTKFITAVRARDVVNGKAPGMANNRENKKHLKKPSMPSDFKNPGVNGCNWVNHGPEGYKKGSSR